MEDTDQLHVWLCVHSLMARMHWCSSRLPLVLGLAPAASSLWTSSASSALTASISGVFGVPSLVTA